MTMGVKKVTRAHVKANFNLKRVNICRLIFSVFFTGHFCKHLARVTGAFCFKVLFPDSYVG